MRTLKAILLVAFLIYFIHLLGALEMVMQDGVRGFMAWPALILFLILTPIAFISDMLSLVSVIRNWNVIVYILALVFVVWSIYKFKSIRRSTKVLVVSFLVVLFIVLGVRAFTVENFSLWCELQIGRVSYGDALSTERQECYLKKEFR